MTQSQVENPAVARRQLGFLETFDKKYEGFRRELERLERLAGSGGPPPAGGWPTEGLERIARSLVGAGAVYGLPTVTTWARSFLDRLDSIRQAPIAPESDDFTWLAEQIGFLAKTEADLTLAARQVISPATVPPPEATTTEQPPVEKRTSSLPPPFIAPASATEPRGEDDKPQVSPLSPQPRPTPLPRIVTPVPPPPKADATVPVPSRPPPPPVSTGEVETAGVAANSILSAAPQEEFPIEARDERLVSRAWQVLALVALLALGFSLWFNYRMFASFSRDDHRGAVTATDVGRALAEPPAPPSPARPAVEHAPEPTPAPEPASAPQPTPEPQAEVEAEVEAQASGGYRRGPRGDEVDSTDDDEEEQRRKERRARRKKRDAEAAESSSAGGAPGNPYVD